MQELASASTQKKPILVEILAYAPTQFYHCQHCEVVWQPVGAGERFHQEQLETSIPEDLQREYSDLSNWVRDSVEIYGGRVVFKVIDAASVEGFLKSVRYGVRRFPTFVVDGKDKHTGTDMVRVKQLIDGRVKSITA